MSNEVSIGQTPEEEISISSPVPEYSWGKLLYGLFIVVMPVLAFWATDLFKPDWQTGKFSDYLILLLFPQASLLFFLLLAYSILCYVLLLIDTLRYSQLFFVRLGIFTGVFLAFHYSVLSGLFLLTNTGDAWDSLYLIGLWSLPLFFPKLYFFAEKKWGAKTVNTILAILAIALFLISSLAVRSPLFPLALILAGMTVAAPFWCFLILLRAASWLYKKYEFKPTFPRSLGLATWIAGYIAAWRFDILKMYELYAALPPQPPPDCYIATAAAQGHPQIVGSWQVQRRNDESMWVNRQLQILKCTELAFMAVQPRVHKMLRRTYDIIGKPLAKKMKNPFVADLAYMLLKPFDWLARLVLRIIVPEIDSIFKQMYTN